MPDCWYDITGRKHCEPSGSFPPGWYWPEDPGSPTGVRPEPHLFVNGVDVGAQGGLAFYYSSLLGPGYVYGKGFLQGSSFGDLLASGGILTYLILGSAFYFLFIRKE
jgi:hypothetical protein